MKLKKGDICICSYPLRKNLKTGAITKNDCKVRINSVNDLGINGYSYNVFNLDFKRYEKIGDIYLKLSVSETRESKLKNILNESS